MNRRRLLATVTTLPLLAVLIGLGVWQLQRLEWKTALIARIQAGISAPATPLADKPEQEDEFQHVKSSGFLDTQHPLFLYARTKDGVAGVHVFALFHRDDAAAILVDRGFTALPIDMKTALAPGPDYVDGIIRYTNPQAWYEPDNDPVRNQWYWPDLPAMGKTLGDDKIASVYIEAVEPTGETGPIPTGSLILSRIRNEHLNYALFWFSMAAILAIIYGIFVRKK